MRSISRIALPPLAGLAMSLAACSVPCDRVLPMSIGRPEAVAPAAASPQDWLSGDRRPGDRRPGDWRITRRDEPLDRRVVLVGEVVPQQPTASPGCLVPEASVRLGSLVDTSNALVRHELHVTEFMTSTGWHYWNTAQLANGAKLVFHGIDRKVGECSSLSIIGCRHNESFSVELPDSLLRDHADKGMTIETGSTDGHNGAIELLSDQLTDQLAAVDAFLRTLKPQPPR
ncbi:MAG: hypothetical protein WCK65_07945 [Rhodospirillaceae bacterium]